MGVKNSLLKNVVCSIFLSELNFILHMVKNFFWSIYKFDQKINCRGFCLWENHDLYYCLYYCELFSYFTSAIIKN